MRERLIELIDKAKEEYANDVTDHTETEYIVETLLNDGWIRPPCKVGDKVYRIVGDNSILAWEIISMECFVDEIGFVDDSDNWIAFDDIGKTVFLTREEAERALKRKEGECNGNITTI